MLLTYTKDDSSCWQHSHPPCITCFLRTARAPRRPSMTLMSSSRASAFEGCACAMMTLDRDLKILHVNGSTRQLLRNNAAALKTIWPRSILTRSSAPVSTFSTSPLAPAADPGRSEPPALKNRHYPAQLSRQRAAMGRRHGPQFGHAGLARPLAGDHRIHDRRYDHQRERQLPDAMVTGSASRAVATACSGIQRTQPSRNVPSSSISQVAAAVQQQSSATSEISATMQMASSSVNAIDKGHWRDGGRHVVGRKLDRASPRNQAGLVK